MVWPSWTSVWVRLIDLTITLEGSRCRHWLTLGTVAHLTSLLIRSLSACCRSFDWQKLAKYWRLFISISGEMIGGLYWYLSPSVSLAVFDLPMLSYCAPDRWRSDSTEDLIQWRLDPTMWINTMDVISWPPSRGALYFSRNLTWSDLWRRLQVDRSHGTRARPGPFSWCALSKNAMHCTNSLPPICGILVRLSPRTQLTWKVILFRVPKATRPLYKYYLVVCGWYEAPVCCTLGIRLSCICKGLFVDAETLGYQQQCDQAVTMICPSSYQTSLVTHKHPRATEPAPGFGDMLGISLFLRRYLFVSN